MLIKTSVHLMLDPKILDTKPPAGDEPLPSLQMAPATMGGSRLLYPVCVDYANINGRLERMLVGQNIDTPLGEPITITGVNLYGSGDKLIVAIKMKGNFTRLLPAGIYPVTGGIEVQMIAQGTVRLVLQ